MKNCGVYTRTSELQAWRLEKVTTLENARVEEEFNSQFGIFTMIAGPLTVFPLGVFAVMARPLTVFPEFVET
jgi:hypothetical protein